MSKGDVLKRRLLLNPEDRTVANDLLEEFYNDYDIANLKQLLICDDERVVKVAIWIGSELGVRFCPLLETAAQLLHHPAKYVRFFSLDCILCCATNKHGKYISAAMHLLNDQESAVRWKATVFLAKSSRDQIQSGVEYMDDTLSDHDYTSGARWLLIEPKPVAEILSYIQHNNHILRKFGAAYALRAGVNSKEVRQAGISSADEDIRAFSEDFLNLSGVDADQPHHDGWV